MAFDKKCMTSAFELKNQMAEKKHAFSSCYVCEAMHAMSTSSKYIEYYIKNNTALCLLVHHLLMIQFRGEAG